LVLVDSREFAPVKAAGLRQMWDPGRRGSDRERDRKLPALNW
jgi:hypothetical protein